MMNNKEKFKATYNSLKCYYLELGEEVMYLNFDEGDDLLELGGCTNGGFYPTYAIKVDYDLDFDENLQALLEEHGEWVASLK